MSQLRYKRILLKLSGEALAGGAHHGLDFSVIGQVCQAIGDCVRAGVQVGVVIGGGNFWRGVKDGADKMQRSHADAMGMLATVMNCLAVSDALEKQGVDSRVLSAVEMPKFAEYFTRDLAHRYLKEGKVVFFACGTGNPYFSTDTGAVLRGVEIEADAVLLAKNVDGVYSADPAKHPEAVKYDCLTYGEALAKRLKATDTTAMAHNCEGGLTMSVDFKEYTRKMDKTLDVLQDNFDAVRAGRANAKVLDRITVEYYGAESQLAAVANISSPDPRTLVIQPWDSKLLKDIQKAIQVSDLGINPQNDGRVIRLVFPQLTEERRRELTKQVRKYAEDAKVALRNVRRDAMDYVKALKKKSEITEDDQKKAEKDLQELTDKYIKKVDTACAAKEKELMAI